MDPRDAIAAVLAGTPAAVQDVAAQDVEAWLDAAWREGVTAQLADVVESRGITVPDDLRERLRASARGHAAAALSRQAEIRRVLACLEPQPVLLLKGGALAHWLYRSAHLRESSDIDLLFADRRAAMAAAGSLAALGYRALFVPGRFAHEFTCRNDSSGFDLDLHWRLSAWPVLQHLPGFGSLQADAVAIPALGPHARGLSPVDALVHAAVHRGSNLVAGLGDRLKWLLDVHLLAGHLSSEQWDRFQERAAQAGVAGLCLHALEASRGHFGTPLPEAVLASLARAARDEPLAAERLGDWKHLQALNLAALPGMSARAAWLWSRLFPPRGYLAELYGHDKGLGGLAMARLRRVAARLLRRA